MKIVEWLAKRKMSCQEFADQLGMSDETVRLWKLGKRRPAKSTARKIVRKTKSEVTMEDLGW